MNLPDEYWKKKEHKRLVQLTADKLGIPFHIADRVISMQRKIIKHKMQNLESFYLPRFAVLECKANLFHKNYDRRRPNFKKTEQKLRQLLKKGGSEETDQMIE